MCKFTKIQSINKFWAGGTGGTRVSLPIFDPDRRKTLFFKLPSITILDPQVVLPSAVPEDGIRLVHIQSLTIAIVFELIYYTNGHF